MGRPRGSRNSDYDQKRRVLAKRVVHTLVDAPANHASLRELARAAHVSVSTMRHYFEDRAGIIEAALAEMGTSAERNLKETTAQVKGTGPERLRDFVEVIARSWGTYRVGRAHAVGLAEGLYDTTGPTYVSALLEPFFRSSEEVLLSLGSARLKDPGALRLASIALLSPVLILLIHQESLGGAKGVPIDLNAFLDEHVAAFAKGWLGAA